jgi:hypothetical protein
MGQYYKTCNIDKREMLNPHDLGDGLKLMEFGMSGRGTLTALAALLIMDRQGVGPWAGNRIVVAGDYADEGRFVPKECADLNLYAYACAYDKDEEEEEAEEADSTSGKVVRQKLVPFRSVADDANTQLQFLGLKDIVLGPRDNKKFPLLLEDRVYDQPEELFEALQAGVVENLRFTMTDVMRTLRMNKVASGVSWKTLVDVQLFIDEKTGRSTRVEARWQEREPLPSGKYEEFTTHLDFPADTKAVRKFLRVKDQEQPKLPHDKAVRLK